jgi:hypothetical protein
VELHRPVLPNRFSWERDGLEAAKVDIPVEPKSLADKGVASTSDNARNMEGGSTVVTTVKPSRTPSPTPANADEGKILADMGSTSPAATFQQNNTAVPPTGFMPPHGDVSDRYNVVHSGPLSSNPVKTWQDIMSVPSQADRIVEFNKARSHYAAADTGLPTILEDFAALHPDVVEASRAGGPTSPVYMYNGPSDQGPGGLVSPVTLGTAPAAMPRHHVNPAQLGAKGKELFATAGKASKGFFSTLKAKGKKVAN